MKLAYIVFVLLAVSMINAQATQLEVLQSLNLARANPKIVAAWIKSKYLEKGVQGINGDATCYQEAFDFLMSAPAVGLISEDAGIDVAAYMHARDQIESGNFNMVGTDKTTPMARLQRFGSFQGSYQMTQLVGIFDRSTAVPANDIVMLFSADCGIKSRKHRSIIYSNTYSRAGAGIYNKERKTMATIVFAKGFTRSPLTNQQLASANVYGDGLYTGAGKSWEKAEFRPQGATVIAGPNIHTISKIQNIDDTNGELGDLKDDKSVVCPTQINSEVLEIRTIRSWTRQSRTCKQGQGLFTTSDNLDRVRPFAKNGKCYHRFQYCSDFGNIFVYDRQYKTQADVNKPLTGIRNELGDGLGDATINCPNWINSKLRIRLVNNWYVMSGKTCTRGGSEYGTDGLRRDPPFAKKGRCYHRQLFCDAKNRVWAKDSEYYTYAQWAATKNN